MTALAVSQPSETPTDVSLLERVAEGSAEALASLYDRHAAVVYSIAARTTGDATVASDIVQETFLALWDRAELFDPTRGSLRGWLFAIARNRAIDHVRRTSRHDRALAFSTLATGDNDDGSLAEWLTTSGEPVAMAVPIRPRNHRCRPRDARFDGRSDRIPPAGRAFRDHARVRLGPVAGRDCRPAGLADRDRQDENQACAQAPP